MMAARIAEMRAVVDFGGGEMREIRSGTVCFVNKMNSLKIPAKLKQSTALLHVKWYMSTRGV